MTQKSLMISRRDVLKAGAFGVAGKALTSTDAVLADDLLREFQSPAESARPWVYWYFMDGYVSLPGMKEDLDAMKRAGIGGAIFLEVGLGIPPGPVEFMSEEWRTAVTEAFAYADQLGIEIALAAGPGWCGTGGPWVTPEESMQYLVGSKTEVTGPRRFKAKLPQPAPRTPFFGEQTLTPELRKEWEEFYRDVMVFAFPTPSGELRLEDVDEKALYTRGSYSSQILGPYTHRPWIRPFLTTSLETNASDEERVAPAKVIELTDRLGPQGELDWEVPAGAWTILRMGRTTTAQTTRPAPKPIGLESDKFNPAALEHHFEHYVAPLLAQIGTRRHLDRGLTTLHFDSWEMGCQNWSERFREEFKQRRGYDALRYMPAFSGYVVENVRVTEGFLWDVRQTAQEMVIEHHIGRLQALGRERRLRLSLEPYDLNPCSDLQLGSSADVPMGEFWSKRFGIASEFSVVEATSIGHTTGKKVIASESFTAHASDLWLQHPAAMKDQTDWALCAGINRIVFHRFQAQAADGGEPGMTMGLKGGYGIHWDRTQTWWEMVPAYHLYLNRCQQMLRRGLFVADILYLAAEGAPNVFVPPGSSFMPGLMSDRMGYNFDGCAPEVLTETAQVRDGRIVFPDGMSYRLLVLPQVESMTPRLVKKIKDLVEGGAAVMGMPPSCSPSLVDYPHCDAEVREIAQTLWGSARVHRSREAADVKAERPLAAARWIWTKEAGEAGQKRVFSRTVEIEDAEVLRSVEFTVTASSSFQLWINGMIAAEGDTFSRVQRVDVTHYLKTGRNTIEVAAAWKAKDKMPPGLLGALTLRFMTGASQQVVTDASWTVEGRAAVEIGEATARPWSLNEKSPQEPSLYPGYRSIAGLLAELGVQPDFAGEDIRYIHRQDGKIHLYFVGNRREDTRTVVCSFRVAGYVPEWWDPITGKSRLLPEFHQDGERVSVPIPFGPFESGFVVFRRKTAGVVRKGRNALSWETVKRLKGPWRVAFDPKRKGPGVVVFPSLSDWSIHPDATIQHFSGRAVYSFEFEMDARDGTLSLSLGKVYNMASVSLNGQDLGTAWCEPWRVAVPHRALKRGTNRLEITVANLWVNRMIGDSMLPVALRSTQLPTETPFNGMMPLQPSGLIGPVTIERLA